MRPVIAVTGHRPDRLGGYTLEARLRVRRTAEAALKQINPGRVITGMALGWDQAVAESCVLLGIPFVAAVPFYGQESRWPESGQRAYNRLLGFADEIVYVNDGEFAPWKMTARNHWMVDNSQALLTLYDGSREGGTAECVEYARSLKRPIKNLWREFAA